MDSEQVCFTFEGAVEKAIQMEEEGFRNYLNAIRRVHDPKAREILRENALDELNHKNQLENALLDGRMQEDTSGASDREVPVMNLHYVLKKQELVPESGVREALVYAIHLEKDAVDFYSGVAAHCSGAPMGVLFDRLRREESLHLQRLEDLYERHFMTEN